MDYKKALSTLGLTEVPDEVELKKVYRKMARKYHPDTLIAIGSDDTSMFIQVKEAYEYLKGVLSGDNPEGDLHFASAYSGTVFTPGSIFNIFIKS